jgi:hypothetical protein
MPGDRTGVNRGHRRRGETNPAKRKKPGKTYPAEGPNTEKGRTSMSSHDTMNPYGGVDMGRVLEPFDPNDPLPGYGSVISVNRPVRTRMPGGVGAGRAHPPGYPIRSHSGV